MQHLQGRGAAPADGLRVETPDHPAGDVARRREHHLGVDKGGGGDHAGDRLDFGLFLLVGSEGAAGLQGQDVGVDAEDLVLQLLGEAGHHPDDDDQGHDPHGHPGGGDEGAERQEAFLTFDSPEEAQGHEGFKKTQDLPLRPEQREQDDIPDGGRIGEEHHQAVDADAFAGSGRQAVLQGLDVVLVQGVRHLFVAGGMGRQLLFKAPLLVQGIVELGEAVGHLPAGHEELEAVHHLRIGVALPGQGRGLQGIAR